MAAVPVFRNANWERILPMFFPVWEFPQPSLVRLSYPCLQRQARRLVFKQARARGPVMKFLAPFTKLESAFRKFVAPRDRLELYYIRTDRMGLFGIT
jgi:hypothetical protein